ncbi:hypothetical protein ACO22_07600 [Paracoccidioides brasiliensis]|uniref:Phosphatidic acid phosphatase type 2/haloperoxidase domain-containing protein n=1 Tax=Paracoccidioides brasiliensis TaxID=121759 RepID=A0A1D2J462_PARBR|nr:hypothetical protein ACO22_07600 [Paracoccidioides brasiliensis]
MSSPTTQWNPSGWGVSRRVVASYVLDWALILLALAVGRILKFVEPNRNPFSLTDPSISYPYTAKEAVSSSVLVLISVFVPAITILLLSLLIVPGLTAGKHVPASLVWRRKLWEWNAGWMGLGLAIGGAYAATEALKVICGKPRPDLINRCNPDIPKIAVNIVGGLGRRLRGAPLLVSYNICQNKTTRLTREGFLSFPSGHASISFAGLTYLTLWLCAKLSISIPYLSPRPYTQDIRETAFSVGSNYITHPPCSDALYPRSSHPVNLKNKSSPTPLRDQSAAPPIYLLLVAAAPIVAAAYISSSRWFDNRHFGFDILFGALLGISFAWLGFRWYHLPLSSGAGGWAWSARSPERAFYVGIGVNGYAGGEIEKAGSVFPLQTDSANELVHRAESDV